MSTERKIRASQLNGAKSRGPVTSAGRLRSSANSTRHHLLSRSVLLDNERPEAFADLLAGLTREFNPQTETQRALVETMAVSRWRQMRVWAVERATLQSAMDAQDAGTSPSATRAALAFRSLADESRVLDLLHRYETRFDRQFSRSLNLLMKLASPDNPLTQFCQTNLIPQSDTSGAGLPACATPAAHPGAGADGASEDDPERPSDECLEDASESAAKDASADAHVDASGAEPEASPTAEEAQPAPDQPHPGALAHFPTFTFDSAPHASAPVHRPCVAAAAVSAASILEPR
jgi:hypothetical protein